jgi:transforming growth factor-beta-induced protein
MKPIRILIVAAIMAAVTLTPRVSGAEASSSSPAAKDIVAVASGAGSFKTLVAAVKAAGLVETLQGTGPFTVFAPTDEAFAKLPAGTVENLLKPENKAQLVAILTYHVVAGKVMAADVKTMQAKTVNGKELSIKVADGNVTVDGAKVVKTDVAASNGVIHVIDTVVLPKS